MMSDHIWTVLALINENLWILLKDDERKWWQSGHNIENDERASINVENLTMQIVWMKSAVWYGMKVTEPT